MRLREQDILSTHLLKRFQDEANVEGGNGQHCAIIIRDNGGILIHHPWSAICAPDQLAWAEHTLKRLNVELHHDGAWVIVFTHPTPVERLSIVAKQLVDYERYVFLWLDRDGDVQIPMEWSKGVTSDLKDWTAILLQGDEATMNKAESAWQIWADIRRDLDLQPGQTIKRAQGEPYASVARH